MLTNVTVSRGQAFHIYHVIRSHWLCVAWTWSVICNKNGRASTFICIFITKLPARPGWAQKPCFPLKGAPVPVQCAGGCSTPPPTSPSPQAGPAEPESDWLCALGCVILCSRVMSPWLTITPHSVLLFSSEPLNGSLAFNKTAEPAPNSALTPLCLFGSLSLCQYLPEF